MSAEFHSVSYAVQYAQYLWKSPETMEKLRLSTKFPHQEIWWHYGIFRSVKYKYCLLDNNNNLF